MLRGRGRGGGEYTVLEVKGYPGDVVQYIGEVPPGLNRKCLGGNRNLLLGLAENLLLFQHRMLLCIQVQSLPLVGNSASEHTTVTVVTPLLD